MDYSFVASCKAHFRQFISKMRGSITKLKTSLSSPKSAQPNHLLLVLLDCVYLGLEAHSRCLYFDNGAASGFAMLPGAYESQRFEHSVLPHRCLDGYCEPLCQAQTSRAEKQQLLIIIKHESKISQNKKNVRILTIVMELHPSREIFLSSNNYLESPYTWGSIGKSPSCIILASGLHRGMPNLSL
jgi:hypothetical protein